MAYAIRRQRRQNDIWPGFVDALATLLMVIIFLLMIFVIGQVVLSDILSGKDVTLAKQELEIKELKESLDLAALASKELIEKLRSAELKLETSQAERKSLEDQITDMTARINSLVSDLETTRRADILTQGDLASRESLITRLRADKATLEEELNKFKSLTDEERKKLEEALATYRTAQIELEAARERNQDLRNQLAEKDQRLLVVSRNLEDAYKTIEADKEKVQIKLKEIAALVQQVEALQALKRSLEEQMAARAQALNEEEKKALEALGQVALLNEQLRALKDQMKVMKVALEESRATVQEQKGEIDTLTAELNKQLLSEVNKLKNYRSDFFGRLRQIMGDRDDIRIVGDRFVFQSEVLFARGSDEIGGEGQRQLARVAAILKDLIPQIPDDIDWVLRVDGHTDASPISTPRFPSNWELSTARAISVVRFFMDQGISPDRLAATGFGEHHPLEQGDDSATMARNRRIEIKFTQR